MPNFNFLAKIYGHMYYGVSLQQISISRYIKVDYIRCHSLGCLVRDSFLSWLHLAGHNSAAEWWQSLFHFLPPHAATSAEAPG